MPPPPPPAEEEFAERRYQNEEGANNEERNILQPQHSYTMEMENNSVAEEMFVEEQYLIGEDDGIVYERN